MFPRGWTSLDLSVILPDGSGNRFREGVAENREDGAEGGRGGRGVNVMRRWLQLSRARVRGRRHNLMCCTCKAACN